MSLPMVDMICKIVHTMFVQEVQKCFCVFFVLIFLKSIETPQRLTKAFLKLYSFKIIYSIEIPIIQNSNSNTYFLIN